MSSIASWIWAERAWLLSGLIPTVLVAAVPAVRWLRRKRAGQTIHAQLASSISAPNNSPSAKDEIVDDRSRGRRNMYDDQTFTCEEPRPETILEEIRAEPPLQREQKASCYSGIHVRWSGQLFGLSKSFKRDGYLRVRLASSMTFALAQAYLDFEVPYEPEWGLQHLGTVFAVAGIIDRIDENSYSILLRDAKNAEPANALTDLSCRELQEPVMEGCPMTWKTSGRSASSDDGW